MLIDGADAVRIAIRNQPRIALLRDHRSLCRLDMRQNRLRVDPRKRRIDLVADLDKRNPRPGEDARNHAASRAVHHINQELVSARLDRLQVDKLFQRREILWPKVNLFDGRGLPACGTGFRR